jgi:signal transduction histidine kinase
VDEQDPHTAAPASAERVVGWIRLGVVLTSDALDQISAVSPDLAALIGVTSSIALAGSPVLGLFTHHARPDASHQLELARARAHHVFRSAMTLADGGEIRVLVSVSRIEDKVTELASVGRMLELGALDAELAAGGRELEQAHGVSLIVRDNTSLKHAKLEALRARAHAEEVNRELESFGYTVAHDLRAPLRSIEGFSHALLEDHAHQLDETGRRYLRFVCDSARRMAQRIDDLLALSRVTERDLQHSVVDLSELARESVARLAREAPSRHVEVTIRDGLTAYGDGRLLEIVLDNLIGNAWKFTSKREAARVEVGAAARCDQLVYFVRDNGAGFDVAAAATLFGVFQRFHAVTDFEGTGIGLATVQRIVHRHGGRVWAESEPGRGATFYFSLGPRPSSE